MAQRHSTGKSINRVSRIDHILIVDQRQFLGYFAATNLRVDRHCQRGHIARLVCPNVLPFRTCDLAMGRMLFARDLIGIPAEGQTKEVAPQRNQNRNRHRRWFLVLPGTDVVRLDRLFRITKERDRSHVPAQFGDSQFDLLRGKDITRLRANRLHWGIHGETVCRHEKDQHTENSAVRQKQLHGRTPRWNWRKDRGIHRHPWLGPDSKKDDRF